MVTSVFSFIVIGLVAGALGALAMNVFMRFISAGMDRKVNMVVALGSLFSGSLEGASRRGTLIHFLAGIFFGWVYLGIFTVLGVTSMPAVILLGAGIGFFHGMLVSYALMFYVAEKHPVPEFRKACFQVGSIHLVGHVFFGVVVGIIVGL